VNGMEGKEGLEGERGGGDRKATDRGEFRFPIVSNLGRHGSLR
jgi:hypothetical protein